jgi:hypothetical protein
MSLSVTPKINYSVPSNVFTNLSIVLLLIFIVGVCDTYFFGSALANVINISQAPTLYVPLFAFPHILSSLFILFSNTDDVQIKNYVLRKVLPVTVAGIAAFFISKILFDVMFLILLTQHIAGQAVGMLHLSGPNGAKNNRLLSVWKWLNYPALATAFLMIYTVHLKMFAGEYLDQLITIATISISLSFALCFLMFVKTKNFALLLTQIYFAGVYFFAIKNSFLYWGIIFILGHDVVAFLIYQNYYENRMGHRFKAFRMNFVLPVILSVSLISFSLYLKTPYIVFFFQFAHYFAERYCWRSSSSIRKFVSIQ